MRYRLPGLMFTLLPANTLQVGYKQSAICSSRNLDTSDVWTRLLLSLEENADALISF